MRRCVLACWLASLVMALSSTGAFAQDPPVQTFVNTVNAAGGSVQVAGATTTRGPFEPFLASFDPDDGSILSGFFLPYQGAFVEHTYVDGAGDTHAVVTRPGAPTIYAEILANGQVADADGTELPVANAQPFGIVPAGASSIVLANADDQVHAMWFGADGAHRGTQSFEFPLTMSTFGNGALIDGGNLLVFGNAGAVGGFALRLTVNEQTAMLTTDNAFDGDGFLDVTGLNDVAAGTPVQFAPAVNPARYVLFGPGSGGVRQQSVGPTGTVAGDAIAVPGVAIARAAGQLAAGEPVVLVGDVPPSGQSPFRFGLSLHPAGGAQSALSTSAPFNHPTFAEGMALAGGKIVVAWTDSPSPGTSAGGLSVFDALAQPVFSVGVDGHIRINPVFDINDPPVNHLPGDLVVTMGETLSLGGVSISDPDADASDNMLVLAEATNGELASLGGRSQAYTLGGTLESINTRTFPGLAFIPAAPGEASVKFSTSDLGHNGAGGPRTDVDTLRIVVLDAVAVPGVTPGPTPAPPAVKPVPDHSASFHRLIEEYTRSFKRRVNVDQLIVTTIGPGSGTFDLFAFLTNPGPGQVQLTFRVTEPPPALRGGANAAARRKPVRYKPVRKTLAAGGEAIVRLEPPAKLRRQLARALKRKGRVARRPTLTIASSAGGKATVKMRFTVRKAPKRR